MEGLKKRVILLSIAMFAFGMWINLSAVATYAGKNEKDMERMAPPTVSGVAYRPSADNSEQSYRMDKTTYDRLKPYGIVCRRYEIGQKAFDVVLIASQSRGSFHDPRVCFSSQGWNIDDGSLMSMDTTRGKVPFTLVRMAQGEGEKKDLAMYFYRGPGGFYPNVLQLKWGMFKERLRGGKDVDGVFYRIIPEYQGATVEDLKQFATSYLADAQKTSSGYF